MKISVEYAHIYTHQQINDEHRRSVKALVETLAKIEKDGDTAYSVVMVDDYSFPDPTFDYGDFTAWLEQEGCRPHLVVRESQLIPVCDEVLKLLGKSKLRQNITEYIQTKQKYPCSLFIAAWYLLRLGHIKSHLVPAELRAEALVNILPENFKPVEEKAMRILKAAGFESDTQRIRYNFLRPDHSLDMVQQF